MRNAIGTAMAQQAPLVVTGTEHFADALTPMACAATPVTDGAGEMVGVIDLTYAAEDFNPLQLTSPPGRGTSVDVRLPVAAR
jgi:sigma-54 dependent transcriptional regulator, acetoin dehydrogenase operon transcriptional activator AcoR